MVNSVCSETGMIPLGIYARYGCVSLYEGSCELEESITWKCLVLRSKSFLTFLSWSNPALFAFIASLASPCDVSYLNLCYSSVNNVQFPLYWKLNSFIREETMCIFDHHSVFSTGIVTGTWMIHSTNK